MEMPDFTTNELVIFKSSRTGTEFEIILDGEHDTVWVTEQQLMDLYGKARRTIGEHIRNIYKEGELEEVATTEESSVVQPHFAQYTRFHKSRKKTGFQPLIAHSRLFLLANARWEDGQTDQQVNRRSKAWAILQSWETRGGQTHLVRLLVCAHQ